GGFSMIVLTALEYAHTPDAEPAYHVLSSESADLTFRWYKTTDGREAILLGVVYNDLVHRRNDYACSTKWDLRLGDWLALLSGVRSSCAWRSTHTGSGDGQPGGTTHDNRRGEPGGRMQAVDVDAR